MDRTDGLFNWDWFFQEGRSNSFTVESNLFMVCCQCQSTYSTLNIVLFTEVKTSMKNA